MTKVEELIERRKWALNKAKVFGGLKDGSHYPENWTKEAIASVKTEPEWSDKPDEEVAAEILRRYPK